MKSKRLLLIVLSFTLWQTTFAYDIICTAPTGQTLYYSYYINGGVRVVAPQDLGSSEWSGYTKPIGTLVIPDSVTFGGHTYPVIYIEGRCFYNCSGLTSVTIGNSVTSIGNYAFYGCSGLTSVTIGNAVRGIGEYVFLGCSGLTSVTIGPSVRYIRDRAFFNCNGLTTLNFNADSCVSAGDNINNRAFYNCNSISTVNFGNNVKLIPPYLLYNCTMLTSITIGDSVTNIGDSAFAGCIGVTTLNFNADSCVSIGNRSFYNCTNIISVNFGGNVKVIPQNLLYNCSSMTSVTIPNSVISIGQYAFSGCSGLTGTLTIPNSVTSIGNNAFSGCSGLTGTLTIPNSVTSIGGSAFYGCSGLTSVTIGSSVTSIQSDAFRGCSNLDTVYMMPVTPPQLGYSYDYYDDYVFPFDGNAPGRVFILTNCTAYTNYYNQPGYISWSQYRSDLRDPIINIVINVTSNDIAYGVSSVVAGRSNRNVRCDSTVVIQATPNYKYHFDHWSNGSTANPDTLQLVSDSTVMAIFVPDTFLVHATVNYSNRGVATVSDSLVAYLDSVDISATANYGYHFTRWNDNDTHAMRRVRVIQNTTYTAQFDYNQYQLTLNVDNPVHGSVSNGGTYNYLSVRTISATANYGYHFDHWSDGDTNNTRTIVLTQDTSLTAYFANNQYAVIGIPNNSTYGTVSGSDTVDYLDTVVLTATANTNYYFSRWSDGITVNPRAVVANSNCTVIAYFNPVQFTLTVASSDATMGRVSGGGNYDYLSNRTISAIANSGYHFTQWHDGVTSQTRTITLTQDTSFTAFFAPNQYTLTLLNANPDMGSVEGGGAYYYHDTVIISATAVEHHHFVQWSDGNRDNPRQYLITGDATLTANFAIDTHTVNISANDIARGSVSSTGTRFVYGTPCTVTATAYTGYTFVKWSNGVTANPYTFAVMNDMELTAIFLSPDEMCTVTVVSANPSMGAATVDGSSSTTVMSGEEVTLTATPYAGYRFVQWQDNDTHSHRTVTVTSTITYTAYFAPLAGIREADDDNGFRVFAQGGQIVVEDAGEMPVMLYDATGRLLATQRREEMHGGTPVQFNVPASGTYLIKVGSYPARKVVVIR